jgi:L,D-peptidoglycan transpeptidase YkuD (ErfK/YbiS/YcfS/YnhG family)
MIIINKSGVLKYKVLKFRCALGKAGVGNKKSEGDNITPKGNYKIVTIYYRKDRVKKITSKIKLIQIKKDMGWCDDPRSESYNQLIKLPTNFSCEKLFRKENIYDLIIVLD